MPMQYKQMLNTQEKKNNFSNHFRRDELDFYWNENGCRIIDKSGNLVASSVDTHFEDKDEVYEFYSEFAY